MAEAAQIKLIHNVVHFGQDISIVWGSAGTGMWYEVRYEFGTLSGSVVRKPTYNTYTWTVGSDLLGDEMSGNVMDGTLYLDTYDSGDNLVGTTEATFTVARENVLIPEFSTVYLEVGEPVQIAVNSNNWIYRPAGTVDKMTYRCGNASGTIRLTSSGYMPTTFTAEWTPPLSLAKEFPTEISADIKIDLETEHYNLMSETTTVLGTVTVRIELRVPNNEKTRPQIELATNPESNLDATFDGLYIRGKTKVKAQMSAVSDCSDITEQFVSSGSLSYNADNALFEFTADSITIKARAVDARGYETTVSKTVASLAYSKPSVTPFYGDTKITCARCLADMTLSQKGENLLIAAGRKYTSIKSGTTELNKCMLRYRYKEQSAESYGAWVTFLAENDEALSKKNIASGVVLVAKTAYSVQIQAVDTLGEQHTVTIPISAVGVPLHLGNGGRNVSVGQYCDYSHVDAFDIGFTAYFNTGAAKLTIFENGSWTVGTELSAAIADADLTAAESYNLFIAVSGGIPVLCVKAGGVICGGSLRMTLSETDGAPSITLDSADAPVTALYKLI